VNNPAAVFGTASPPVGFTTNVRSQNGSNLVLKTGTPLNSPNTFVPVGYPGPAVDGGAALVGNAGRYNLDLPDTLSGGRAALQTVPDNQSFGASLRHRLSDRVELLFDAARFENRFTNQFAGVVGSVTLPATAVSNPFTSAINVVFPPTKLTALSETWSTSNRVLAGVVVRLPRDWSAGLDYVWSRAESGLRSPSALVGDPDGSGPGLSYTAALANGSLNVMRDLNAFPLDYGPFLMPNPFTEDGYTLRSDEFSLRGSGPVYRLPAGPAILSASAQVRDEEIASGLRLLASTLTPTRTFNWDPPAGLKSRAYTGELLMPVFAGDAAGGWRRGLQVQLAGRRDEIKVNARALSNTVVVAGPDGPFPNVAYLEREYSATKATAGFKYQPVRDLAVRASWGTGFLAPSLAQLAGREPVVGSFQITDPRRGNQQAALSLVNAAGGNPNLLPEESESLSGGLVLTPRFLPGFRLSVDYTRITKTDEIGTLSFDQLLALEDRFPERITRAPLTPQDQALGYTGGVVQGIDNRSINIAGRRVSAWDIQVDYTWNPAGLGRFEAYALATYQPDFSTKPLPDQPFTQVAGDLLSLLWRGNGGLNWTKGRVSVGWNLQYLGSYRIYSTLQSPVTIAALILNQGSPEVAAQIYHDVQVRYDWGNQPRGWRRILAGTQLTLGVQNVFDSEPSITPTVGFVLGSYSPLGDPRLRRYVVNLQRQF
jgi:outer membrane receptor protein involved in Fe transport